MKHIDELLKKDLTPDFVPDDILNQSILRQAKENEKMKRNLIMHPRAAAAAIAGVLIISSASVYAVSHYLTPSQVAERLQEDDRLAAAFEGEDAVWVNETQNTAGYDVTFLGIVTGKDFVNAAADADLTAKIEKEKTYAVTAISHSDGSPMPSTTDDDYRTFCVSPLIHGKTFQEANNGILNAGVSSFVYEGIQYELLECDNLEIFADRGVSLGVVENFGEEIDAFQYHPAFGTYSRNEDYDKINALFELPLDLSKADPEAAEAYFDDLKDTEQGTEDEPITTGNLETDEWLNSMCMAGTSDADSWNYVLENASEDTKENQTVTPDADGYIFYRTKDGESENQCYVGDWAYDAGTEVMSGCESDGTLEGSTSNTITLNEDGTFTIRYYVPKL